MSNEVIIPTWDAEHRSQRAMKCVAFLRGHKIMTPAEATKMVIRIGKEKVKLKRIEIKETVKANKLAEAYKKAQKAEEEQA